MYLHPSEDVLLTKWNSFTLHLSLIALSLISLSWFIMIIYESGQGYHTEPVQRGLRYGFWLFLVTEGMLFFSFFWAYFHFALNPSIVMGNQWPAEIGIQKLNPYAIPLLNTVVLLSSGFSATAAHRAILTTDFIWNKHRRIQFYSNMMTTLVLAYIFLACQAIEYMYGIQQSWVSNVYWSIFFLLTGFHGLHVLIGTLFLQFNFCRAYICDKVRDVPVTLSALVSAFFSKYYLTHEYMHKRITKIILFGEQRRRVIRGLIIMDYEIQKYLLPIAGSPQDRSYLFWYQLPRYNFTTSQHLGLEASLYYWHFVDAIWIALYLIVYLWGR